MNQRLLLIAIAEVVVILFGVYGYVSAYAPASQVASTGSQPITLTGAGATLAYPLLSAVKSKYQESHPEIRVNYQPVGSIAGLSLLMGKTLDFAATYPPIPHDQWKNFPSLPLHIPESISAVVLAYNVPGLTKPLQLTGNVTGDIFLGKVTKWNDQEITNLNPGQTFPDSTIDPFHLSEAEGTTFVFTSYLCLVSPAFLSVAGKPSTSWPSTSQITVGSEAQTDAGIATELEQTKYSIGYMELSYALKNNLPYASIQNRAGNFIVPSEASTSAAAQYLPNSLPSSNQDWSNVNLLLTPGVDAYPLVSFTYLIVYQDLSVVPAMDLTKAKALAEFVWYLVHDGQSLGPPLGYVPLPANIVAIDEAGINLINFRGQHLRSS